MLAAGAVARAPVQPRPGLLAAVAAPACLLAVIGGWLGAYANQPGTTVALIGPALPMLLALPGLWVVCVTVAATPVLAPTLTWAGQKALSLLVAQDFLRLVVGTLVACGVGMRELTWPLLPVYVAAALVVTKAWDPLPAWCASRLWPASRGNPPEVGDATAVGSGARQPPLAT
jgi:hypothetical protein